MSSHRFLRLAGALGLLALAAVPALAYTAAGDRVFPATLLLPQAAPSDEVYVTGSTLPSADGRGSNLSVFYDKTITERLGIGVTTQYNWLQQSGASTHQGWSNADIALQYLAVLDDDQEFLLSLGLDRNFGGTGTTRVGAGSLGATTPAIYFAKGLGGVSPPYLRPLAIVGNLGYQIGDGSRANMLNTGIAFEYSIPYLESKVTSVDLPELVRGMTPMLEFLATNPVARTSGNATNATFAPGAVYAGEGWEFGLEALLPATRPTGRGVGVLAQFHISLDFFFPDSIGKPIFGAR